MIVDGRVAFAGGINLSHTYENPPSAAIPADGDTDLAYWRDTAMEIRGPAPRPGGKAGGIQGECPPTASPSRRLSSWNHNAGRGTRTLTP